MERKGVGVGTTGMPRTGNSNVVLSRFLEPEYLTVKGDVANVRIAIEPGIGGLDQTRTAVHNQKLVIVLGLIHSSKKHQFLHQL